MKLHIRANLDLTYGEHIFRLRSDVEGLELSVPSLAAAANILSTPDFQQWMHAAEDVLQTVEQTLRVSYKGRTLVTLGCGSWTLSALTQALGWLK